MMTRLLTTIENAINTYLKQDSESLNRLAKLSGKVIAIHLNPFSYSFYCRFNDNAVSLATTSLTPPNAEITGTPLQLAGVMLAKENRQQFFADDVNISGDAETAFEVVELFDKVQIDWEEHTARLLGDIPAHHIGQLASQLKNWVAKTSAHFTADASDYLHEETEWFPVREELNEFFADIDTLRMDADRLEARFNHLKSLLNEEDIS